jgi:hypothetical protein
MSKAFPDPLHFKESGFHNGSMLLMLTAWFRYFSPWGKITVPLGFITDGASVPRIFWNILSPFGEYAPAAIIHDFLYSKDSDGYEYERWECDQLFLMAMKDCGVGWIKRHAIYNAVRIGGWASYKKR